MSQSKLKLEVAQFWPREFRMSLKKRGVPSQLKNKQIIERINLLALLLKFCFCSEHTMRPPGANVLIKSYGEKYENGDSC